MLKLLLIILPILVLLTVAVIYRSRKGVRIGRPGFDPRASTVEVKITEISDITLKTGVPVSRQVLAH